jgi:hypothetical protein
VRVGDRAVTGTSSNEPARGSSLGEPVLAPPGRGGAVLTVAPSSPDLFERVGEGDQYRDDCDCEGTENHQGDEHARRPPSVVRLIAPDSAAKRNESECNRQSGQKHDRDDGQLSPILSNAQQGHDEHHDEKYGGGECRFHATTLDDEPHREPEKPQRASLGKECSRGKRACSARRGATPSHSRGVCTSVTPRLYGALLDTAHVSLLEWLEANG